MFVVFRLAGDYTHAVHLLRGLDEELSREQWTSLSADVSMRYASALAGAGEYSEYVFFVFSNMVTVGLCMMLMCCAVWHSFVFIRSSIALPLRICSSITTF